MFKFRYLIILLLLPGAGVLRYVYKQSDRLLYPAILVSEPVTPALPAGAPPPPVLAQTQKVAVGVDGGDLTVYYTANNSPQSCAVILVHAEFSDHRHALPYGEKFLRQGCDVIAPDMRGYSGSRHLVSTWGKKETSDISRIIEYVKNRKKIQNKQIGLMGISLGAYYTAKTAELYPDLAFVLLDSYPLLTAKIIENNKQALLGNLGANVWEQVQTIAGSRCDCEIPPKPSVSFAKIQAPVFLAYSKQDTLAKEADTVILFGTLPTKKVNLFMPSWPAARTELHAHNPQVYNISVLRFIMTYAPDFLLKK